MKLSEKYTKYVYMAIIVVLLFLLAKGCANANEDKIRISELLDYKHEVKNYMAKDGIVVDYNNSVITTLETLVLTNDSLVDYIDNLKLKMKNVEHINIVTERIKIDTLYIPVPLTECGFDTTIQIIDSNYNMNIRMTNEGLTFNTLEFPNRLGVTLASKRDKWYSSKKSIVTVTNSNPYMKIDGISSYELQQDIKWWQKRWVHVTGGVILGSVATYKILK